MHPPLAKMLVGLALKLAKFDGEFQFDSGKPFPENFDYGSTRRFLSAMGALAIPFLFSTAYNMGLSAYSCLLVAVFSIFGKKCCLFLFILHRKWIYCHFKANSS